MIASVRKGEEDGHDAGHKLTKRSRPMLRRSLFAALVAALLISIATSHARGDVITFEAQGAGRGGQFTGNQDSPLSIGPVTFQGGELLNGETGFSTDETAVYAIMNFHPG
jgi:hypothetical protein